MWIFRTNFDFFCCSSWERRQLSTGKGPSMHEDQISTNAGSYWLDSFAQYWEDMDLHWNNNWNRLPSTLLSHQRTTLSWVSYINICISFNVIIILGHISTSDNTFEPFTSQRWQKPALFNRWSPVGSCSVYVCCWTMPQVAAHSDTAAYKPREFGRQ